MNQKSNEVSVTFGKVGRTVEYRDRDHYLVFSFDIDSTHRSIILEHHAVRGPRPAIYAEAFARSRQFLQSCGHLVEESGVAHLPDPLTEKEVTVLLSAELGDPLPPGMVLLSPTRASFEDDSGGRCWQLWVVAQLESGRYLGHKIVFDEYTKHFGVVTPANVFAGFWGPFRKTVDALVSI